MGFFIKEWPNKTATLMADTGAVLWTFHDVDEALRVCREWYNLQTKNKPVFERLRDEELRDDGLMDPLVSSCAVA